MSGDELKVGINADLGLPLLTARRMQSCEFSWMVAGQPAGQIPVGQDPRNQRGKHHTFEHRQTISRSTLRKT